MVKCSAVGPIQIGWNNEFNPLRTMNNRDLLVRVQAREEFKKNKGILLISLNYD